MATFLDFLNKIVYFCTKFMKRPSFLPIIIGTGFGAGFWPWGPGTAGAVVATLVWWALAAWLGTVGAAMPTVALIVTFTLLGTWATAKLMPYWGSDPSRVVVDEMVGVWIPLLAANNWWQALLALLLFRLFDIVKPLGIKSLDRREGAFWVMADDIAAGIYAGVVLLVIEFLVLWAG